jgi:hypothetical protein
MFVRELSLLDDGWGRMLGLLTTLRVLAILAALFSVTLPAEAETLTVDTWRGREVLRLTGLIEEGTAERFAGVVGKIDPFPHGVPVLLLDSPGGSVGEALAVSGVLDLHPFHTVVPNGAKCASACASILFVAGTYRTVEPFGLLGQHSCSRNGTSDELCNEILAQHAVRHGVSHGSIAAFVTHVPPEKILWFSREDADGWGLTRYPGEEQSGFEKSEPRVIKMLTGQMPPAQAAWRIDFREDGFRAFLRPASDAERELQLNLFCNEDIKGHLFMSMEIHGPVAVVADAIQVVEVKGDIFKWNDSKPVVWQADDVVSEVITEVPREHLIPILTKVDELSFNVHMREPYKPIVARTYLSRSRQVLRFAANNCARGNYDGIRPPLQ